MIITETTKIKNEKELLFFYNLQLRLRVLSKYNVEAKKERKKIRKLISEYELKNWLSVGLTNELMKQNNLYN